LLLLASRLLFFGFCVLSFGNFSGGLFLEGAAADRGLVTAPSFGLSPIATFTTILSDSAVLSGVIFTL
jgi:hypothetical protein